MEEHNWEWELGGCQGEEKKWENYPKGWAGQNNYQKWWYFLIILGEDFNRLNIPKRPFN